jgi:hypothetical protein
VLGHFGAEAPVKLNTYACSIEDALIQSLEHQAAQSEALYENFQNIEALMQVLDGVREERQVMFTTLSDPDALSEYTEYFFGPDGPAPVLTPADQARMALQEGAITPDGQLMPRAQGDAFNIPGVPDEYMAAAIQGRFAQPQPVQRPTLPMPSPYGAPPSRIEQWGAFQQAMGEAPQMAWQVLDSMSPETLRTKILAME